MEQHWKRIILELWSESKGFLNQPVHVFSYPGNRTQAIDSGGFSSFHGTESFSTLSVCLKTLVMTLVFISKLKGFIVHKPKAYIINLNVRCKPMKLVFSHTRHRITHILFLSVCNKTVFCLQNISVKYFHILHEYSHLVCIAKKK